MHADGAGNIALADHLGLRVPTADHKLAGVCAELTETLLLPKEQ